MKLRDIHHRVMDTKLVFYIVVALGGVILATAPPTIFVVLLRRHQSQRSRIPIDPNTPRPAGSSLQSRISEISDNLSEHIVLAMILGALMGVMVWWLGFGAIFVCILLGVTLGYVWVRLFRLANRLRSYRLGLLGEQAVGGKLSELISRDCRVFHDFGVEDRPGKPWNIDHIIVSAQGVFSIETKCRRKLTSKSDGWRVQFDGKLLHFPWGSDSFGLDQAKRNADWLRNYIREAAAETIEVTPVLVLPGWYVERKSRGDITVINEKEFPSLVQGPSRLDPQQIQRIAYQISRRCLIDL